MPGFKGWRPLQYFRMRIGVALPITLLSLTLVLTIATVRQTYQPWTTMSPSATQILRTDSRPRLPLEKVLVARYQQEATPNNSATDLRLGEGYLGGNSGAPDFLRARTSLEHAAYKGNPKAAMLLSEIYSRGLGTAADLAKAYAWSEVGAVEGNSVARRILIGYLNTSIQATCELDWRRQIQYST
jgi:TPR repeat protein